MAGDTESPASVHSPFGHPSVSPAMNLRSRLPAALTAFAAVFVILPPARGAVTEAWVQRYSTMTGHSNDEAVKIVRDAAEDVIVAGNSADGRSGSDFPTIKYSGANGAILWQRRYNNPNGGLNNEDRVKALVADANGNVIVTGSTYGAGHGFDWYTAKYAAADGALLWEKYYRRENTDQPRALAMDASGNVTVTGTAYDGHVSETSDVHLTVEASTDLITWPTTVLTWPKFFFIGQNTATSSFGVTIAENEAAPDSITVAIPIGTDKAKFARIKVTIGQQGGRILSIPLRGNVRPFALTARRHDSRGQPAVWSRNPYAQ